MYYIYWCKPAHSKFIGVMRAKYIIDGSRYGNSRDEKVVDPVDVDVDRLVIHSSQNLAAKFDMIS